MRVVALSAAGAAQVPQITENPLCGTDYYILFYFKFVWRPPRDMKKCRLWEIITKTATVLFNY